MTIHPNKELFRPSTTIEKLAWFRSLLDSHEIRPNEALALLGSIHAELRQPPAGRDGSPYARYAQMMQSLHYQMPDTHQFVVASWWAVRTDLVQDQANAMTEPRRGTESAREETDSAEQTVREKVEGQEEELKGEAGEGFEVEAEAESVAEAEGTITGQIEEAEVESLEESARAERVHEDDDVMATEDAGHESGMEVEYVPIEEETGYTEESPKDSEA